MIDEVREVLRRNEALLVHFNGPASRHDLGYPHDLRDAMANLHWKMCYSTVVRTDRGPGQVQNPSDATAFGSVGLVVDLQPSSRLIQICSGDGGSDGRNCSPGLGLPPSPEVCEASITSRQGHNEWFLAEPRVIGIFAFLNPYVWTKDSGDVRYPFPLIPGDFSAQRVFTIDQGQFCELDRATGTWPVRSYSEIVPG